MTSLHRIGSAVRATEEETLQRAIVRHLETYPGDCLWWHTPNSGKRSKATGGRLKAMGMRKGVPDLCFVLADGTFAAMELKRLGGAIRPEQAAFIAWCDAHGVNCPVVSDLDNALMILRAWKCLKNVRQVA